MDAEYVQGVVDAQFVDEFHGEEAGAAGAGADDDGRHHADEAGGGGNGHQAGDGAGGGAAGRGAFGKEPGHYGPGGHSGGRGHVGDHEGVGGVRGGQVEAAAGVEAEPAEPEEAGAQQHQGHVVGRHGVGAEAGAAADDEGRGQGRRAGGDMHHGAAGEVQGRPGFAHAQQRAQVAQPAAAPDPVAEGGVHDGYPEGGKDDVGLELEALGEAAGDQGHGDDGEHTLKGHKSLFVGRYADHSEFGQVADEAQAAGAFAEGQGVAPQHPQHAHHADGGDGVHHCADDIFVAHQAAVEQGQARHHNEHQRR